MNIDIDTDVVRKRWANTDREGMANRLCDTIDQLRDERELLLAQIEQLERAFDILLVAARDIAAAREAVGRSSDG